MSAGDGLRVIMIAIGVIILIATIISLSRKHMTESFCIAWGVVAAVFICAGIVLRPYEWSQYVSWHGLMLMLFGVVLMLSAAFYFSTRISTLNRLVKDLAIRVTILSQENMLIMNELSGETPAAETEENEEKTLLYN